MVAFEKIISTIPTRIKASVLDGMIMAGTFIGIIQLTDSFSTQWNWLKMLLVLFLIVLYEPINVAVWGQTLGHRWQDLKVIDKADKFRIGFVRALLRFLIKAGLGWFSIFWALFTSNKQSLHDLMTQSLVINDYYSAEDIRYLNFYENTGDNDQNYKQRSFLRRFIVSFLWLIFITYAFIATFYYVFFPGCLEDVTYNSQCNQVNTGASIVLLFIMTIIFVSGSKGYLPGAKKRKLKPKILPRTVSH